MTLEARIVGMEGVIAAEELKKEAKGGKIIRKIRFVNFERTKHPHAFGF